MRVLHLETGRHLYGGARQVAYLIDGLKKRGIENVLAAPTNSAILREAASDCVATVGLKTTSGSGFSLYRELLTAIDHHRPDIIHIHSRRLAADFWGGLAARRKEKAAIVSRRVDNPEPRWLARLKYRLFNHVITISDGIRNVLLDEGVPPRHVSTVRSAIDIRDFSTDCEREAFLREFSLPDDTVTIGVIAQLIPRKGHRYLIEALPEISERHPNFRLLFFGQGPERAALEAEVSDAGLDGVIQFCGFRDDLPRWLPCLDLVVHPAEMEGLGVSLIQAAASGVAIVASRAGGMPEIVRDNINGLLVTPKNVAELRAAVERLLADEVLRRKMGKAGRQLVATEFSITTMVTGNLAIYEKVLGGR